MNSDPATWTDAERTAFYARRESRNRALGILLFTLVALFFGVTVVRMADQMNATPKPAAAPPVAAPPVAAPPVSAPPVAAQ